jgi:hypothetical protein
MQKIKIYKDGRVLNASPDQIATVLADGWSLEEPAPPPPPVKPVQKTTKAPPKGANWKPEPSPEPENAAPAMTEEREDDR